MFILTAFNASRNGMFAGDMRRQTGNTPTSVSQLNGSLVGYYQETDYSGGNYSYTTTIMQLSASSGTVGGNWQYWDRNGTSQSCTSLSACGGSMTMSAFDANNLGRNCSSKGSGKETCFYFFDTNSAFFLDMNSSSGGISPGWIENQTQTTFSNAALAGTYLLGQMARPDAGSNATVAVVTPNSSGSTTFNVSVAGQDRFEFDETGSASYSWDSTGKNYGIFEFGDPIGSTCAVITSTKFVCTTQNDSDAAIMLFEQ
jgi:hypothetical protein